MRSLVFGTLMLVATISKTSAQPRGADAKTIARLVDSLASSAMADRLAPGLGVAVTMDGRIIYSRAFGMADVSAGIPADDRTLWYLASTTKSFTGFGLSLLADRGQLKFDAPITSLLPRVSWNPDVKADSLTLAHFLSHTHRVNDQAVSAASTTGATPETQWPSLLSLAGRQQSSDLVYTNFGYYVGAMVIDRLRPEGWRAFLEKEVFLPVGMRDTHNRLSAVDPKRVAKPHSVDTRGNYVTERFEKTDRTMHSAGGHVSTLRDLARWTIVQMDSGRIDGKRVFPASAVTRSHTLLAKQTRDQAKRFAWFDREGWGAGWDVGTYNGERMVSRFGSFSSTRSHLSFLPNRRTGVVVMSGGGSIITDIIAAFVYDLEAGRGYARDSAEARLKQYRQGFAGAGANRARNDSVRAARQAVQLKHPISLFAGTYEAPNYGRIILTERAGKLDFRWGDLSGPVEIFDATKDQLRIEITGSGTVMTFTFPETGPATEVAVQGLKFTRVP
jgi:CubicO group peptidase (beta-lactamase class C family)